MNFLLFFAFFSFISANTRIALIADSQLGNNYPHYTYDNYLDIIDEINADGYIDHVIINGDLVSSTDYTYATDFFEYATATLNPPVTLVHGNHDGRDPHTWFLSAQYELCGYQNMFFSFDLEGFHFMFLPAYHEQDLTTSLKNELLDFIDDEMYTYQNDPVIVFAHYHFLPQGMAHLDYYAQNPVTFRNAIKHRMLKYRNVVLWFAGHVHNGILQAENLAWKFLGANFYTLPTSVKSRRFGDEYYEFQEGINNGGYYSILELNNGQVVSLKGKRIGTCTEHTFPLSGLPSFDTDLQPYWFTEMYKLSFDDTWMVPIRYHDLYEQDVYSYDNLHLSVHYPNNGGAWKEQEIAELIKLVPNVDNSKTLSFSYKLNTFSDGGGVVRVVAYDAYQNPAIGVIYVWLGHSAETTRTENKYFRMMDDDTNNVYKYEDVIGINENTWYYYELSLGDLPSNTDKVQVAFSARVEESPDTAIADIEFKEILIY